MLLSLKKISGLALRGLQIANTEMRNWGSAMNVSANKKAPHTMRGFKFLVKSSDLD